MPSVGHTDAPILSGAWSFMVARLVDACVFSCMRKQDVAKNIYIVRGWRKGGRKGGRKKEKEGGRQKGAGGVDRER